MKWSEPPWKRIRGAESAGTFAHSYNIRSPAALALFSLFLDGFLELVCIFFCFNYSWASDRTVASKTGRNDCQTSCPSQ
eukprot:5250006-Pyramimonas_sp.AAC.1